MTVSRRALRLTVLVDENDTWSHRPLFTEIVHRAHRAGLSGASVFRGCEGFGATSTIHTARLLSLSEDLPVAVVVVDTEERVRAFLPQLADLPRLGLVTLEPVEVVRLGEPDGGTGDGADGAGGEDGAGGADGAGGGEAR